MAEGARMPTEAPPSATVATAESRIKCKFVKHFFSVRSLVCLFKCSQHLHVKCVYCNIAFYGCRECTQWFVAFHDSVFKCNRWSVSAYPKFKYIFHCNRRMLSKYCIIPCWSMLPVCWWISDNFFRMLRNATTKHEMCSHIPNIRYDTLRVLSTGQICATSFVFGNSGGINTSTRRNHFATVTGSMVRVPLYSSEKIIRFDVDVFLTSFECDSTHFCAGFRNSGVPFTRSALHCIIIERSIQFGYNCIEFYDSWPSIPRAIKMHPPTHVWCHSVLVVHSSGPVPFRGSASSQIVVASNLTQALRSELATRTTAHSRLAVASDC